jgi:hypothetical protein
MASIISNKEQLEQIIKESFYKKEVLNKLGFNTLAGNYKTLDKFIKLYELDISHFLTAKDSIKGKQFNKKYELKDILIENFKGSITNVTLKKSLYKEGIKKPCCELCNQSEDWFGKKLSFILDHINGNNKDNRLENIRIICPNCDSTLDTYMGRNNLNINSKRQKKIRSKLERPFIKLQRIKELKKQILDNKVDFSKKTWGVEVGKIMNKTPQYALKFIKKNIPELLKQKS